MSFLTVIAWPLNDNCLPADLADASTLHFIGIVDCSIAESSVPTAPVAPKITHYILTHLSSFFQPIPNYS